MVALRRSMATTATFLLLSVAACVAQDTRPAAGLAGRVVVAGRTGEAIQAACVRAARQKGLVVFLPAGQYVIDKEVRVPGGVCLLGEGTRTVCRAAGKGTHLFAVAGDDVRFTRLKLQGADTTPDPANNTFGITASGGRNVRIDHCELLGFSYATTFRDEAAAQVDHCRIHHNLRNGLGYGVAIYSGAHVLVCDNDFRQNRHSLASNGALDWSSPKRLGRYVHKGGVRKTHWEFRHNRVGPNDKSPYELCAVDTHPGMDGTFVVAANVFDGVRHGVGIRDGSGVIEGNVFRNLRTVTRFRALMGISISYGKHNGIPVEGCMPHHIVVRGNVFDRKPGSTYQPCQVGKAENVTLNGTLLPQTRTSRPATTMPALRKMPDTVPRGQPAGRE